MGTLTITASLQVLLADVARDIDAADTAQLRELAEAAWHGDELPELDFLAGQDQLNAGYLVERLAWFAGVAPERKRALLAAIETYRPDPAPATTSRDAVAVRWGASSDLIPRLPVLLALHAG